MAAISLYDRTSTSLSVQVTGLDTSYTRNDRYIAWWFNGSSYGNQYFNAYISNTNPITITGLSPNTQYAVGARVYYTLVEGGEYSSIALTDQYFTTLPPPRPAYFYWSSYGTGYSPQNRTTVSGKLSIYRPYEAAWNAMRSNIIDMLVYKGNIASSSAFSSYTHYFGTVSSGNSITAYLFNKARSCINAMGGGVSSVTQGVTACTENYFYQLQYYLNSIT